MKYTYFQTGTVLFYVLSLIVVAVATALVIYLTPLRHIALIAPTMHEVDPSAFYTDYLAHPNDYIFIDVRSPNIYQSAHAESALNIPVENLFDDHYSLPHYGKKIVLICTTGRLAAIGYGYLENWGFQNLLHVQGGMVHWAQEGLPIVGTNVMASSTTVTDQHQ